MQKTSSYSKAYVEILEIINTMGEEFKNKVPTKLLNLFEEKKDPNYIFDLSKVQNTDKQVFMDETIGLLSLLELKYWANDEEKEMLTKALKENEIKYQKELREKYNPDDIFKNDKPQKADTKIEDIKQEKENAQIIEHKETIFTKIKNWFKSVFSK